MMSSRPLAALGLLAAIAISSAPAGVPWANKLSTRNRGADKPQKSRRGTHKQQQRKGKR